MAPMAYAYAAAAAMNHEPELLFFLVEVGRVPDYPTKSHYPKLPDTRFISIFGYPKLSDTRVFYPQVPETREILDKKP